MAYSKSVYVLMQKYDNMPDRPIAVYFSSKEAERYTNENGSKYLITTELYSNSLTVKIDSK